MRYGPRLVRRREMNRQRVEVHFHAKGAQVNLRQATRADIAPMHAIRMAVRENALSDPRRIP